MKNKKKIKHRLMMHSCLEGDSKIAFAAFCDDMNTNVSKEK